MPDLHFVEAVKDVVVNPAVGSMVPLFIFSFLNDLIGIFPFAIALAGQLLFLKEPFTLALAMKLLVFVAVPVGIGSTFGSIPLYVVAYFGGKPAIKKFHRFLRFSWDDVEKMSHYFRGSWYDEIIFLLLRCVPVLPSIPLDIASGIIRMQFMPFLVLTMVGSIVRMMLTLLVVGMSLHGLSQI
ncbi:MAG: VTT domain-containing protein [Patescibacteria group bacterium]